jgi:hypothetical protein
MSCAIESTKLIEMKEDKIDKMFALEREYVISHKYRGSCVAFSISKSVEPNEELKVG